MDGAKYYSAIMIFKKYSAILFLKKYTAKYLIGTWDSAKYLIGTCAFSKNNSTWGYSAEFAEYFAAE